MPFYTQQNSTQIFIVHWFFYGIVFADHFNENELQARLLRPVVLDDGSHHKSTHEMDGSDQSCLDRHHIRSRAQDRRKRRFGSLVVLGSRHFDTVSACARGFGNRHDQEKAQGRLSITWHSKLPIGLFIKPMKVTRGRIQNLTSNQVFLLNR